MMDRIVPGGCTVDLTEAGRDAIRRARSGASAHDCPS